jgi:hypothetical protein
LCTMSTQKRRASGLIFRPSSPLTISEAGIRGEVVERIPLKSLKTSRSPGDIKRYLLFTARSALQLIETFCRELGEDESLDGAAVLFTDADTAYFEIPDNAPEPVYDAFEVLNDLQAIRHVEKRGASFWEALDAGLAFARSEARMLARFFEEDVELAKRRRDSARSGWYATAKLAKDPEMLGFAQGMVDTQCSAGVSFQGACTRAAAALKTKFGLSVSWRTVARHVKRHDGDNA